MNGLVVIVDISPWNDENSIITKNLLTIFAYIIGCIYKKQTINELMKTLMKFVDSASNDDSFQQVLTSYSSEESVKKYQECLAKIFKFISEDNVWINLIPTRVPVQEKIKQLTDEFKQCQQAVKEARFKRNVRLLILQIMH